MSAGPESLFDKDTLTFDCYGTLIDWEAWILGALEPMLSARAIAVEPDALLALYAELEAEEESGPYKPYREVLASVVDGIGKRHGFTPTESERGGLADSVPRWMPFPDTVQALRRLKSRYKLAIISNIDDDFIAQTHHRLEVPFDWVITAQQARSYKPSLNNFRLAIERIGLPAERILHVAQSIYHDVIPARELGIATVWVNRRHDRPGPGATLHAEGRPDLEVPDLKTLAEMAIY